MEEPPETALFGWGNNHDGQLGLGSSEKELFGQPTLIKFPTDADSSSVVQVATGQHHSLFVMSDGSLYSTGINDLGQLGRSLDTGILRKPGKIPALQYHNIIQAAVGFSHSLALSDGGQIFSWGCNSEGQCGREGDQEGYLMPKLIKQIAHEFILQIAAGNDFCLALSDVGDIYAWGGNAYGQLGLGHRNNVAIPTIVKSLSGLPVKQIAVGGLHTIILSKSGAVFSTGRNEFGQLGVGDSIDRVHMSPVKSLKNQRISYICCGQEHSVALTIDGGVFSWGGGGTGQLGHGLMMNEILPRKVFELMGGSYVSQITTGRFHTIAYVPTTGKIYGFGLSASGQLGIGLQTSSHPVVCSNGLIQQAKNGSNSRQLRELFAGGDQAFAVVSIGAGIIPPVNFCRERPRQLLPSFTGLNIEEFVAALGNLHEEDALLDATAHRELDVVSGSLSCWNGSFLGLGDEHYSIGLKNSGVDLQQAVISLENLATACNARTRESIADQLRHKLLPSLSTSPPDIECLRIYLLLPLFPIFTEPLEIDKILKDIIPFASTMGHLQKEAEKVIKSWLSITDFKIFEQYVQLCKASLVGILTTPKISELIQTQEYWRGTQSLLNAFAVLYDTNNNLRADAIPYEKFYVPEITDKVNIPMDYKNWYHAPENIRKETLSFCNYPFTFDPQAKTILLQADSTIQMENAVNSMNQMDFINNLVRAAQVGQMNSMHPQQVIFLNLFVSRNDLLKDALDQIWRFRDDELKRPLKVWFVGEDAEDAGGVKKEFFMLLMRELLDPKYGMFTYLEETHSIYFTQSFECDAMFGVVGTICGLAIYNSTIVDVRFPLAVYKKLLGIKTSLSDLDGLMPTVRRGLEYLLAYEGDDFEDVFSLNFTISTDYLGQMSVTELKPNGKNISVTKDNRQEYCDLYVDYILNRAVQKQFSMFEKGFHRVCGGKVLQLFHPQELMAMVCGNENYDWTELEESATYKGDYSAEHPNIRTFWKVFHSLTLEEKQKFLMFLTGCARIPILGMKAIRIMIQPMGDKDSNHLPVAHTCFNILDLPRYKDETTMRSKLLTAMEHTQGFGLA